MKTPKLVACASCPVYLPEESARHVDELVAGLPKEKAYEFRRKSLGETTATDPTERTDVSYITTQDVDTVGDVVLADGLDVSVYDKHRTVFYEHDRERIAGKCLWLKQDNRGWLAKTHYPERPAKFDGDWLPDRIWSLVGSGLLVGKSIGIQPLEVEEPTAELKEKGAQLVLKRALLMEFSVVSIPCNSETIIQAIGKGLDLGLLGVKITRTGKHVQPRTKRVEYIDRTKEFLEAVAAMDIDADAIAERVLQAVRNRGRI